MKKMLSSYSSVSRLFFLTMLFYASILGAPGAHAGIIEEHFTSDSTWQSASNVKVQMGRIVYEVSPGADVVVSDVSNGASHLVSQRWLEDSILSFDYLLPEGSEASLFFQGRYGFILPPGKNLWQKLSARYRAARFDEAGAMMEPALILEVLVDGRTVLARSIHAELSDDASITWKGPLGASSFKVTHGQMALRNFETQPADFSQVAIPKASGEASNLDDLIDSVALGKETFEAVNCNACHFTTAQASGVTSGPNLFGLFSKEPRDREVVEGGEGHRFIIKANAQYLHRSLREPSAQLAVAETGAKQGEAYLPIMPPFGPQVLSDFQIDAIGDYLATLNPPEQQGPVVRLIKENSTQAYDPLDDRLQMLVNTEVRLQRGPMPGVSGRAVHVGFPWGLNYTFDPRILAVTQVWQGGFLDMSGEWLNRGGKGLKMGYESREIDLGKEAFLLAPLNASGERVDFSFKEARFGDVDTIKASLNSKVDHLERVEGMNAQFLGFSRNSKEAEVAPTFKYRVGNNILEVTTRIAANGDMSINVAGSLADKQRFVLNQKLIDKAKVSAGTIQNGQWVLPKGTEKAVLNTHIQLSDAVWKASKSDFGYHAQKAQVEPSMADLPAGYRIESYFPPLDNYGREQLFEALGLAETKDKTLVVATRTAGIWRLEKGAWRRFAEGTFDSLGLVVEDEKGLDLIVGQKAELTRIRDTNGDGIADHYDTLFDAHSYHGNYHSYMHGPVKGGDGAYYFSINLADGGDGSTYKAGGKYMGSAGGLAGWLIRVTPEGDYTLWANGLRSPAGLGTDPEGRLWYSENQGEYVGTSKLFVLEKDGFYGHPSSLVDLPGMLPESPEIQWDAVWSRRVEAVALFPHNRVANSPGNPAWDTTAGLFGPFAGQMFIGDQTQSNLLRVDIHRAGEIEQGSVLPFAEGLASGVMRPVFLQDGSLMLGQTGRGWQAKGGQVAALQRIVWDGKTIAPAIKTARTVSAGFELELTQALPEAVSDTALKDGVMVESWVYRDAPDYGSDELDRKQEPIKDVTISADRKQILIQLSTTKLAEVHPQQTARVYKVSLTPASNAQLHENLAEAFVTVRRFPAEPIR